MFRHYCQNLEFDSIPVRVTISKSRKQRRYVVSEFLFYTENRLCPLLVRYSWFVADSFVLSYAILSKLERKRSVHCLSHSRLCGLEHMGVDVQSLARLCVTFIEFNLSDFRGDYYGFKEKFFIFSAIKNRQWVRMIIMTIFTLVLILIQSNTIFDYDISPETQSSRSTSYSEKS